MNKQDNAQDSNDDAALEEQLKDRFQEIKAERQKLVEQLKKNDEELKKIYDDHKGEFLKNIIKQVKEFAAEHDVSDLNELVAEAVNEFNKLQKTRAKSNVEGSTKKSKLTIKYRNPNNHNQTWVGRGAQPNWLKEAIKNGSRKEDFLIDKEKAGQDIDRGQ